MFTEMNLKRMLQEKMGNLSMSSVVVFPFASVIMAKLEKHCSGL